MDAEIWRRESRRSKSGERCWVRQFYVAHIGLEAGKVGHSSRGVRVVVDNAADTFSKEVGTKTRGRNVEEQVGMPAMVSVV